MERIGISLDDELENLSAKARMVFLVNRGRNPGPAVEQAARQIKVLLDITKGQLRCSARQRSRRATGSKAKSEGLNHQWGRVGQLCEQALLEEDADLFTVLARAMEKVRSEDPVEPDKYLTRLVLFHEAESGSVNLSQVKKCLDTWRVKVSLRHLRRIAKRHCIQTVAPGRPRQNRTNDTRHR